jgi:hypothetical protein
MACKRIPERIWEAQFGDYAADNGIQWLIRREIFLPADGTQYITGCIICM